jgi:hypothetical protein
MTCTRRTALRICTWIGIVGAFVAILGGTAQAQSVGTSSPNTDSQVVLSGRLVVPSSQTVASAVIFNGNATVDGTVTESLVVFNGDATVTGTVRKDVLVFNGNVDIASGARVEGNVVARSSPSVASGATVGGKVQRLSYQDLNNAGWISRFSWWLGYSISTLILGLVLLLGWPGLDGLVLGWRRATGASIGWGVLLFVLAPIVAVLLIVIVIALPLGLFLLLALGLLYTVAYMIGAHVLGRAIVKPPTSRFLAFLAGWAVLRILALIPFIGGLLWVIATIVGAGVLIISSRRADRAAVGPPPPPAPAVAI